MTVDLGDSPTSADLTAVAYGQARAGLGEAARERIRAATAVLDARLAEGRRIYGVTTGYGPLAGDTVSPDEAPALQRGLVYHLAAGVGPPLSRPAVRATIAARLASLALGWSAVSETIVDTWLGLLNADLCPEVPVRGTVGASGDLTPLAHIALASMGEAPIYDPAGAKRDGAEALAEGGLAPIALGRRDGLALVNGTAAMTGQAALNDRNADAAIACGLRLAAAYGEVLGAPADGLDPRLGQARAAQNGQAAAHARLNALLADSQRLTPARPMPGYLAADDGEAVQAAYSFRCVPQEFGAAADALGWHSRVVAAELASASDNPLVDTATGEVLHGGNFYGQPIAYASDLLADVTVKLAAASERRLARLCEPTRNNGLPAFLRGGAAGLNSGFMGAQVSASALIAEMRSQAGPVAAHSISTNNANQDVVTLGTIAARKAGEQLDWLWQVMAIEGLALTQAIELCDEAAGGDSGFSDAARHLQALLRRHSAPLAEDRPLAPDIAAVAAALPGWAVSD